VRILLPVLAGLLLTYLALLAALWAVRPGEGALKESLRLLPDVTRVRRRKRGA